MRGARVPNGAKAAEIEIATRAAVEGTKQKGSAASPGVDFACWRRTSTESRAGIHGFAFGSAFVAKPTVKSDHNSAGTACLHYVATLENPADPVKNAKVHAFETIRSSVKVSIIAGSPPASVSVPATTSSSNKRISV